MRLAILAIASYLVFCVVSGLRTHLAGFTSFISPGDCAKTLQSQQAPPFVVDSAASGTPHRMSLMK